MTAAERFAQARPRLLRLAYSELGDVGEAEDVVQEAWLRLERADAEAIENLDGWLTTVVARLALDRLRSARARRETYVGPWLPEPLVSDDPADRVTLDESVSYALLTVLEQLSPAERTAFVLHDVFDVPFGDVAEVVGRTPEAVRQLASRARRHVTRERPRFAASRDEHDRAVRAFAQAVAEGSLEGLVAVLDPDVVWTSDGGGRASAARKPLRGGARVARAWAALSRKSIARTDRDRAQRAARAGAPERRRPSRGALVRRQRRSHHAHRRGPQPGEAAAPRARTLDVVHRGEPALQAGLGGVRSSLRSSRLGLGAVLVQRDPHVGTAMKVDNALTLPPRGDHQRGVAVAACVQGRRPHLGRVGGVAPVVVALADVEEDAPGRGGVEQERIQTVT